MDEEGREHKQHFVSVENEPGDLTLFSHHQEAALDLTSCRTHHQSSSRRHLIQ
jgi:hypothetical protein